MNNLNFSYQKTSLGGYDAQIEKYQTKRDTLDKKNANLSTVPIRGKVVKSLSGASEDLENESKKGKLTLGSKIKKIGIDWQIKTLNKKIDSLSALKVSASKVSEKVHVEIKSNDPSAPESLCKAIQNLKKEVSDAPTSEYKRKLQAQLKGLQLALKEGPIQKLKTEVELKKKEVVGLEEKIRESKKNQRQEKNHYQKSISKVAIQTTQNDIRIKEGEIKSLQLKIKNYKKFSDCPSTKAFENIFSQQVDKKPKVEKRL